MIQISKDQFVTPAHIVLADEGDSADGETVGILHLSNGAMVWATPAYWPAVKAQLVTASTQEGEVLAAIRFLDEFKTDIELEFTVNDQTVRIPARTKVTDAFIALAKALQENGVKAP